MNIFVIHLYLYNPKTPNVGHPDARQETGLNAKDVKDVFRIAGLQSIFHQDLLNIQCPAEFYKTLFLLKERESD